MSQLDMSMFYSHLLGLLFILYIFAHFSVVIISTYYYNVSVSSLEDYSQISTPNEVNKVDTLMKMLE